MKSGAISVALAVALAAGCSRKPSGSSGEARPNAGPVTIKSLMAERAGKYVHLTVTAQFRNSASAPIILAPPVARLWIDRHKSADPFIAPGLEPAVIAPGAESDAATHWWLAASDLSGLLELEISGARSVVKSTDAFDIESLPENQTVGLQFPQWRTP